MSKTVIHLSGGVAEVVAAPNKQDVVILDFDNYKDMGDMGSDKVKHRCPSCIETSTEFEWNAATIYEWGDIITPMQKTKKLLEDTYFVPPSWWYTCPRCLKASELKNILAMEEVKA